MSKKKYTAIDLFSGVGGLSSGMRRAGFNIAASVELDHNAVKGYLLNFPNSHVIPKDIRLVGRKDFEQPLLGETLHLLAGCPPCQGFSSIRRLNKKKSVRDKRNSLILEYLRLVKELKPLTIMMENVPGLEDYYLFKQTVSELKNIGYNLDCKVVNVKDYRVPQRRKRLVLLASILAPIKIAPPVNVKITVEKAIKELEHPEETLDAIHKIYAKHCERIQKKIELIPKNGGSLKDLSEEEQLACHQKDNVGFNDVYGRLRWNDYSTTITGGCLNPSKGRFLHPEEDRCITAREAALLQSFPKKYKFPTDIPKTSLALLIGNALPPRFSYYQSKVVKKHLDKYLT